MLGAPMKAYVWWCGDEECDCTQPVIVRRAMNPNNGRVQQTDTAWSGTYRVGGTWDEDDLGPTNELNRVARIMRRRWHDAYRMVEWPWDRAA